ncbi:hypothetical protein LTR53_001708 [Teratosphaeriaceae sp. CCFEE 6253]|nr:hypothetical protein LTR53_001708 [Teratosphaeriaceae sp. CCFEE 6253]
MAPEAERRTLTVPSHAIPSQAWWPALHATINEAYLSRDVAAIPKSWGRLNSDPKLGAASFVNELGPKGHLAVIFLDDRPIACSGFLPFRGENWILEAQEPGSGTELASGELTSRDPPEQVAEFKDDIPDWEVCCFCVHPEQRGSGLSRLLVDMLIDAIKPRGAKRLIANYSPEETGEFWPNKMGFTTPVGSGTVLRKGFKFALEAEGLREDLHFRMAARLL